LFFTARATRQRKPASDRQPGGNPESTPRQTGRL